MRDSRTRLEGLSSPSHRQQLANLDEEVRQRKRAVRQARTALQEAAGARRRFLEQLNELGIELVEQGVEE